MEGLAVIAASVLFMWRWCGSRRLEGPQLPRLREFLRRICAEAIDLNAAQNATALKDEHAKQVLAMTDHEVSEDVDSGRCFRLATDLEVETRAATHAAPCSCFSPRQLREKLPSFRVTMLKHPLRKLALLLCERTSSHSFAHDG